jgi:transposase-like protein
MGTGRTDEFRKDAVRIALISGLSRKQIADDLGVGMWTLNKWITAHPLPSRGLRANRERGRVGRLMRETEIVVERPRKFKVEEGQEMIRRIISPTTHG